VHRLQVLRELVRGPHVSLARAILCRHRSQ
jgi:hypothetical protein